MAEEKKVRRRRPAGAAAGGFQVVGFPKEFEKNYKDELDYRFMSILGSFLILTLVFIIWQNIVEHGLSTEQLQAIRADAMKKLYAVELVEEETVVEEAPADEGTGVEEEAPVEERKEEKKKQEDMGKQKEVRRASAQERAAKREVASAQRAAAQRAAEQKVASQGVLGLLTAGGGGGEGAAVVDILGDDAGGTANLSDVMTGVGGLAVAESQGQRTRTAKGGGRVSSGAGIDELVEGIGTAKSSQLSRKGKISIAGPASVSGRGSKSANRKPDVITKILRKHQAAIDFCYQKVAKLNPNLKGEVIVRFAITADGRTSKIKVVRNTLQSRDVERCIVQKIRGWRDFPKIDRKEGDVTVQQKYAFGS